MVKSEEKTLAAAIYVLGLFFPVLGPLIIWLIKKDESSFIDYHGKEYFNFVISYFIYTCVCWVLAILLIGFVGLAILGIMGFVFSIIAAVKAFEGYEYRIPWIFRFIK